MSACYLFLFHSTLGVVQLKKRLLAAGADFDVQDVPRELKGGCGLSIMLRCAPGEQTAWYTPGQTETVWLYQEGNYHLVEDFRQADQPSQM